MNDNLTLCGMKIIVKDWMPRYTAMLFSLPPRLVGETLEQYWARLRVHAADHVAVIVLDAKEEADDER